MSQYLRGKAILHSRHTIRIMAIKSMLEKQGIFTSMNSLGVNIMEYGIGLVYISMSDKDIHIGAMHGTQKIVFPLHDIADITCRKIKGLQNIIVRTYANDRFSFIA